MQGSDEPWELTPWGGALQFLSLVPPFVWGRPSHYFKQCDLFCSFHAIVEVQFGGLARLDRASQ